MGVWGGGGEKGQEYRVRTTRSEKPTVKERGGKLNAREAGEVGEAVPNRAQAGVSWGRVPRDSKRGPVGSCWLLTPLGATRQPQD